jgi:hypothetical protein
LRQTDVALHLWSDHSIDTFNWQGVGCLEKVADWQQIPIIKTIDVYMNLRQNLQHYVG